MNIIGILMDHYTCLSISHSAEITGIYVDKLMQNMI